MSGMIMHGLGDCTPEKNCGCVNPLMRKRADGTPAYVPNPQPVKTSGSVSEPLLVQSMRSPWLQAREIRIVGGSGTTVRGFLAEFDEYVGALKAHSRKLEKRILAVSALADNAERRARASLSRDFNGNPGPAFIFPEELRRALMRDV